MPRYLVRQPNGLYAEFSTIVDAFTIFDMTEAEALEHYRQMMSPDEAAAKVRRGVEDQPLIGGTPGSGSDRWSDALKTMRAVNPKELERQRREYPEVFLASPDATNDRTRDTAEPQFATDVESLLAEVRRLRRIEALAREVVRPWQESEWYNPWNDPKGAEKILGPINDLREGLNKRNVP